jgi:hypothetical protein
VSEPTAVARARGVPFLLMVAPMSWQAEQELPDVAVDAQRRRDLAAEKVLADVRPQDDGDRERERDREAVAQVADHRVHRHAGVTALPVPVGVLGALHRAWSRAAGAAPRSAIGSQTWPGTDRPAQR